MRNLAVVVAIGADGEGYQQVFVVVEGAKEDAEKRRQVALHTIQSSAKNPGFPFDSLIVAKGHC